MACKCLFVTYCGARHFSSSGLLSAWNVKRWVYCGFYSSGSLSCMKCEAPSVLWIQEQQAAANADDGVIHRDVKYVMGHVFEEHSWRDAKGYCEKCNGVIIAIVQTWRRCNGTMSLFLFNSCFLCTTASTRTEWFCATGDDQVDPEQLWIHIRADIGHRSTVSDYSLTL